MAVNGGEGNSQAVYAWTGNSWAEVRRCVGRCVGAKAKEAAQKVWERL